MLFQWERQNSFYLLRMAPYSPYVINLPFYIVFFIKQEYRFKKDGCYNSRIYIILLAWRDGAYKI